MESQRPAAMRTILKLATNGWKGRSVVLMPGGSEQFFRDRAQADRKAPSGRTPKRRRRTEPASPGSDPPRALSRPPVGCCG